MKLFHFTTRQHWQFIKGQGLTKGAIPQLLSNGQIGMRKPYQWLTEIPDWIQDWDFGSPVRFPRTEIRIEIDIPRKCIADRQMIRWAELSKKVHPEFASMCAQYPSSKYWWIFRGPIPKAWFITHAKPDYTRSNDLR